MAESDFAGSIRFVRQLVTRLMTRDDESEIHVEPITQRDIHWAVIRVDRVSRSSLFRDDRSSALVVRSLSFLARPLCSHVLISHIHLHESHTTTALFPFPCMQVIYSVIKRL